MCFDAFAHTSRPPQTCPYAHTSRPPEPYPQKRYFLTSGVVKNVSFYAFLDYQNHVLKK
jgi:hypothetical protein